MTKEITRTQARKLTDCINAAAGILWDLIVKAYIERAWDALGYTSWDEYCSAEFSTTRLRLPREERAEVVSSLRDSGLSLRAIEAATGVSRPTIIKDLSSAQVVNSLPPDDDRRVPPGGVTASTPGVTDRVQAALAKANATESKTTGADGKTYPKKPARQKNEPDPPVVEDDDYEEPADHADPEPDSDRSHLEGAFYFEISGYRNQPTVWAHQLHDDNADDLIIDGEVVDICEVEQIRAGMSESMTPGVARLLAEMLKSALPEIHAAIKHLEHRAGTSAVTK